MSSLYEVLGVARDADAATIKAAYRRKAAQLHPDRTSESGATEAMAKVNDAYNVLSDPEMRARYDQTGSAATGLSRKEEINNVLAEVTRQVLGRSLDPRPSLTAAVMNSLEQAKTQTAQNIVAGTAHKTKLEKLRAKLRGPQDNIMEGMIVQSIMQASAQLVSLETQQQLLADALAALAEYESDPSDEQAQFVSFSIGGTSTRF